jgi:general secretion pathway protein G
MARQEQHGTTYLEVVATTAIMAILAGAALPVAQNVQLRTKEMELKRALVTLRAAIDRYRLYCEEGVPSPSGKKIEPCRDVPYPPKLEDLVEEKPYLSDVSKDRFRALRRDIPKDPMTESGEWDLRCYEDDPDAVGHCGRNVWDVRSKSTRKALDGTPYNEW